MASEKKTNGKTIETIVSAGAHKKFKSRCKKLNVSMSQRIRDLIQQDLKK